MQQKLFLIGIGVSDERGISLRGLDTLKACGKLFAETYTNLMPAGTLSRLELLAGKKIALLSREHVENEKVLLDSAASQPTALLVAGDPMIATTHISLLLSAKKKGIATEVIHSSSILSAAIGESGLQAYKFGKTVTLAYWRENYKPMAAYDVMAENLSRGLHTLLLLDIDEKLGPMPPAHAANLLLDMEMQGKKKLLPPSRKIVMLQGIGWQNSIKEYSSISDIAKQKSTLAAPAVLIIPGKLHFLEEEFLAAL